MVAEARVSLGSRAKASPATSFPFNELARACHRRSLSLIQSGPLVRELSAFPRYSRRLVPPFR